MYDIRDGAEGLELPEKNILTEEPERWKGTKNEM